MLTGKKKTAQKTDLKMISISIHLLFFLGHCTLYYLIYRKCSNTFLYSEVIRIFLMTMFHYLRSQVFRGGVNTMHMINAFITHVHLHMYEMSQLNPYCK